MLRRFSDRHQPPTTCEIVRLPAALARRRWTLERFGLTPRKFVARVRNRTEPRVLCVSLPKAGTHLLERALCLHPRMYRRFIPTVSEGRLTGSHSFNALLDSLHPGQIVLCHLAFTPEYRQFSGWLEASDLVVRFEDLVAPEQSGDHGVQRATLRALYQSIGLSPQEEFFDELCRQLISDVSPTFRTGKTGGWRTHFDAELEDLFRATVGTELARYGYD
jgi:hypothetical protein